MRLSIIVPVYNVRAFLPECLESLVNQTIEDYEIILVDDGSTDGSADIIEIYGQRYPELIKSIRIDNGGQGRARNFGIDMAKGDYLGFVDSDDWVTLDMYEKLYLKAIECDADVVVCDFLEKFSDGREGYLPAALQNHKLASAGSSCNKIFRRSLVGNIRFPQGLWYEDFYFSAIMLLESRQTEFITEPLYIYRKGQESTMNNNNAKKNLNMITIMDMLADYMCSHGLDEEFEFLLVNHVGIDSINRLAAQKNPDREVIARFRDYIRKHIPKLSCCTAFKAETRNRRIICMLNYLGLEQLSRSILSVKNSIKKS